MRGRKEAREGGRGSEWEGEGVGGRKGGRGKKVKRKDDQFYKHPNRLTRH